MDKAIRSVLQEGYDDVEILIVNDGSKDRTALIADRFASEYPGKVYALHQENRGHGGAVNKGIRNARGMYFKVLDSDDWFDSKALEEVINTLRVNAEAKKTVDLLITNYVYEKEGARRQKKMKYGNILSPGKHLSWNDMGSFRYGQYLMMHSLIFRTDILRKSGLILPEHTFYVDNLFVNVPLPYVKSLQYLDVDLYRYYIGRDDQSVNEEVMIRRIDQQLKINKLMLDNLLSADRESDPYKIRQILYHHFEIVTSISSILLIKAGDRHSLLMKEILWSNIKRKSPFLHNRLRRGLPGIIVNLSGTFGRLISSSIYDVAQRVVGFN